ncbi:hypothetical protein ABMA27_006823 [Loxostege sticticalis]|uniref:Gamma-interferon-inducible lysosomal thiol reductase n=1 Tax=Loxostege sticticalis TaxID=481309 RepID=A0ABR3IKI7_LOXSC
MFPPRLLSQSTVSCQFVIIIIIISVAECNALQHLEDKVAKSGPLLELFYESMCPESRKFYTTYFSELVSKLGNHVYFISIPYGKAATATYYNSTISFWCQHGDAECYGNKLHACALGEFQFTSCLMEFDRSGNGSDDAAVDACKSKLKDESQSADTIKKCAKGDDGTINLLMLGKYSVTAHYTSLPHIKLNGKHWTGKYEELFKDICATFTDPPEACKDAK